MFAVIFEVKPRSERWNDYLELAKQLRPKLEAIDGFIDNERFGHKTKEGWLLSLSTWRDEKSVIRWRTLGEHHGAQEKGRGTVFEDYHLRVGEITTDSAPPKGMTVARQRFDETETGAAKSCTLTEVMEGDPVRLPRDLGLTDANGLVDEAVFESITTKGKLIVLASWRDKDAAERWRPTARPGSIRHRIVLVIRDYGMFDRREAPQFYPPAPRG